MSNHKRLLLTCTASFDAQNFRFGCSTLMVSGRCQSEQVVWPNKLKNVAQAASAIEAFVREFKTSWIIARLNYKTPLEALEELLHTKEAAD